jgi:transcriptional regulator with XRE-family HTH domain
MSAREAFGPNLRRLRMQRGITLESIARETKVNIALWAGLEKNDLSRWPTGIYARAYMRSYAQLVGADPEATVDEFCRLFPNGDRRAERLIRGHAQIVGHPLAWQDPQTPDVDRRTGGAKPPAKPQPTGFRRWLDLVSFRRPLARNPR